MSSIEQVKSTLCYQYASDVVNGKIVAGEKVILVCRRFIDDLEKSVSHSFRWTFDMEKAYRPIQFMERFLIPTKGDYSEMKLLPWQHFVEGSIYGWVDKETGLRRYNEALIIVGSGNGKSTLVSGNAIYGASKDGERGAEVYLLANSKDQAGIIYGECVAQIENNPILRKHFRPLRNGIFYDKTGSKIERLATDSKKQEGRNVHLAVFDELQDYQSWKLINVIKAKTKKRKQPLVLYITTLGNEIDGPLMDLYVLGDQLLKNEGEINERVSDRMFVYIAEIDEGDDPEDRSCWAKANPSIGPLLTMESLEDEWERCKLIPSERANFINKQLNVFTNVDEMSMLDAQTILKNNKTYDLSRLEGQICYGGFDLSESQDFTSACLEFPLEDRQFFVLSHSWVPVKKVKEDHEKLDWAMLESQGYLTIVPGDYVDYELVYEWFERQRERYIVEKVGYDPAKAYLLVQQMQSAGYSMDIVRQGELTLTAPLDHLTETFLDGNIITNNDPLYRWYLKNVKLTKRGPNATYLPTKQNKYRKIDGFAAHLDAHVVFLRDNPITMDENREVATIIQL